MTRGDDARAAAREPPAFAAIEATTAIKPAASPVAVRTLEPHAPATEIGRRVMVTDALDDILTVAAVAKFGIRLERTKANAAGLLAAAMPGESAAPARPEQIVLTQIDEFDPMPCFASASAAIVPAAVPTAHM
jgi:hypothetical protein